MTFAPVYVAIHDAIEPRDGKALTYRWWIFVPEKGLVLAKLPGGVLRPQCNRDRRITESLAKELYPGSTTVYMSVVFAGHNNQFGGKVVE